MMLTVGMEEEETIVVAVVLEEMLQRVRTTLVKEK
jgi:hypothetical protein